MTKQQRLIWLLSIQACAGTNQVLQEFTRVQYNSGEQNEDMTKARQKRDMKDTVILSTLADRNHFALDPNLRLCLHGTGSKRIRSENRNGQAFCLQGTVVERVRNGSKAGLAVLQVQFWIRFRLVPERFHVNTRTGPKQFHVNRRRSGLVRNGSSPIPCKHSLRNIMIGEKADNAVIVNCIRATGENILFSMTGRTAGDYTFKGE